MVLFQVNGFRYENNLNDITLSATLNVSDDTVTCIIPDNVSLFVNLSLNPIVTAAGSINVYTECDVIIW